MPLDSILFENGIFYCREYGNISAEDAIRWAEKANEFAKSFAPNPIVALVDALEVKFVSTEARLIFAKASGIQGLALAAVVTNSPLTEQSSRIINRMALKKHTHLFNTVAEARAFLEAHIPYVYADARK